METKFTQLENEVLSEIYRRLNYFHKGNLDNRFMLLALPSEAKRIANFKLIKPMGNELPKAYNWYELTEKGKTFFSNYVEDVSENENTQLFEKLLIKIFDKKYL